MGEAKIFLIPCETNILCPAIRIEVTDPGISYTTILLVIHNRYRTKEIIMRVNYFKRVSLFLLIVNLFQMSQVLADGGDSSIVTPQYFSGLDSGAAQTVIEFHRALQFGDQATAKQLLSDNVVIYEGGGIERSADEYANHHLKSDLAFLKQMKVSRLEHQVKQMGNTALSISRSRVQGIFRNRQVDAKTMETIILNKFNGMWKIVHIHWSN